MKNATIPLTSVDDGHVSRPDRSRSNDPGPVLVTGKNPSSVGIDARRA
jgi:hypothetical protein